MTISPGDPILCVTSDTDWASDYCIADMLSVLKQMQIRATVFATHKSEVLERFHTEGLVEIGIHPNFMPGSTHGSDRNAVINYVVTLYPEAKCFRSHRFADDSLLARELIRRGIRYDSNVCVFLQPDLVPLFHATGLIRFPVFWEDDAHWDLTGSDWDVCKYIPHFLTPGLKILNIHPFFFAANIPSGDYYQTVRSHITSLDSNTAPRVRFAGEGTRTFVMQLLGRLHAMGLRFYTLAELYEMTLAWPVYASQRTMLKCH